MYKKLQADIEQSYSGRDLWNVCINPKCRILMESKESTKEETNKSAIAIGSSRKGGRWRNGALVRSTLSG